MYEPKNGSKKSAIASRLLIENSAEKQVIRRVFVHLDETPVTDADDPVRDANVRITSGQYALSFSPFQKKSGASAFGFPYILYADILTPRCHTRVASYEELSSSASSNPEIAWIIRNTDISPRTFEIAHANLGARIPVTFSVLAYCDKVGTDAMTPASVAYAYKEKARIRYEDYLEERRERRKAHESD